MSKPKRMETWQRETKDEQTQAELDRKAREDAAKKKLADDEPYSYQVFKDHKLELETKQEGEAIRLAKGINGKVIYCIESCGLYQIYPPTTPKHDHLEE